MAALTADAQWALPVQGANGLQCMSFGLLPPHLTNRRDRVATVLRGRETAKVAIQLALGTQWGDERGGALDVLVVDTPPGTGDVSLGLLSALPVSAAVVVSTPSPLAEVDVRKGAVQHAHVSASQNMPGALSIPLRPLHHRG